MLLAGEKDTDGVTVKVAGRVDGERDLVDERRSDARSRLCAAWPPAERLRGAMSESVPLPGREARAADRVAREGGAGR